MQLVRRLAPILLALAAPLLAAACSSESEAHASGGAFASNSTGAEVGDGAYEDGDPVRGNVSVTWKNLNPANPPASASLVNESSEIGQKLRSGRANSSEIRVLSDAQMGGLLEALEKSGFFRYATDGLGLDTVPDLPGKKAVIIVTQDGHSKGLVSLANTGGSPIPKAFYDSKMLILGVHSQLPGADIKAGIGAADDSIFTAPPPRLRRP